MRLKKFCVLLGILFALTIVVGSVREHAPPGADIGVDFVQYWAGGRALLHRQNPYDIRIISDWETQELGAGAGTVRLWNPPTIFPVVLPFAALPYGLAMQLWICAGILISGAAIMSLAEALRFPSPGRKLLAIFCCASSSALVSNVGFGQSSHLALAGLAIFLCRSNGANKLDSFGAGIGLGLTLIKPHLLGLCYIFLIVKSVFEKRRQALLGLAASGLFLGLSPLIASPSVFSDYLAEGTHFPIYWQTPTLGSLLQGISGIHSLGVRMLPFLVSAVLLLLVILARPGLLKSENFFSALIPWSLALSPYGWTYDQLLLLPSVVLACSQSERKAWLILGANLLMLSPILGMTQQSSVWYPVFIGILTLNFLLGPADSRPIHPPESRSEAA